MEFVGKCRLGGAAACGSCSTAGGCAASLQMLCQRCRLARSSAPTHHPLATHRLLHAGETWWSSQFLLPGTQEPLSKEQQIAVTHALAAWGEVVDGLPEDAQGTTAELLEEAWAQVRARAAGCSACAHPASCCWRAVGRPPICHAAQRGQWLIIPLLLLLAAATAAAAVADGCHDCVEMQLLASGKVSPTQVELAQRAWRWREHLQRAMDGCDSTADQRWGSVRRANSMVELHSCTAPGLWRAAAAVMPRSLLLLLSCCACCSAQGLALYDEMPGGVHCALPAGMQVWGRRGSHVPHPAEFASALK